MKELIPLTEVNPIAVFKDGGLDAVLKQIHEEASTLVPDTETAEGRADIDVMAKRINRSKTYLDEKGKTYVAELKLLPGKIDAERKRMREFLDDLKMKIRKPLDEWEANEKAKTDAIQLKVAELNLQPEDGADSFAIESILKKVAETIIDESFGEFKDIAKKTKDDNLLRLEALLHRRLAFEAEQEKIKAEADAKAKAEQEARERRLIDEAKAKAEAEAQRAADEHKLELERIKLAAEKEKIKAEQDKVAAIAKAEQEKQQAIKAEQDRLLRAAEAAKAKAEEEQEAARVKARNKEHRRLVNNEAATSLALNIPKDVSIPEIDIEKIAKCLVIAIASGNVDHIKITY